MVTLTADFSESAQADFAAKLCQNEEDALEGRFERELKSYESHQVEGA
jgi:hypothetical protein